MKLFKRTRITNGKETESRHWYAWVVEPKTGKRVLWNSKCHYKEAAEEALRAYRKQKEFVAHDLRHSPGMEANLRKPLIEHAKDYTSFLEGNRCSVEYIYNIGNYLRIAFAGCGWKVAGDVSLDNYYVWRTAQRKVNKAAKTLREYQAALTTFFNWMKRTKRVPVDLFEDVDRVTVDGRKKRVRRVVTPDEFQRLLDVAGERGFAYYVVLNLGLRRGDGNGLTWGDLFLDEPTPYWISRSNVAKHPVEKTVALNSNGPELCDVLRRARPANWKPTDKVFPKKLPSMHWFYKDLKAAKIERLRNGERVDLHALRTTFCTHVSNSGVPLVQAVQFMRHTDSRQTAETYYRTDIKALGTSLAKVPLLGTLKKGISKGHQNIGLHGPSQSHTVNFNHESQKSEPIEPEDNSSALSATGTDGPLPQIGCPARIRT